MRKTTLLLGLLLMAGGAFAQNCDKLLEGGLYSITGMSNTGSFRQDLRTYFLSEQFRNQLKSGKWGGSVTIPVNGGTLTLGSDSSESKLTEFRNRILETSELNISEDFYSMFFGTIPNTTLYQSYVECVRIEHDASKTGFIPGLNVESEDVVIFNFYFRPQAPGDAMPVVTSFDVQPVGSVLGGRLVPGQTLNSFSFLVTCRRDPEKDLLLSLQTDRGAYHSKVAADGAFSSSSDIPIGTVVASMLSFEQFSFTTKNNERSLGGIWTANKSRWSPCDGRAVPNSKYSKISSQTNVPDLRGLFLRGLNSFDPTHTAQANPDQLNPSPTPPGAFQRDAFAAHNHEYTILQNDRTGTGCKVSLSGCGRGAVAGSYVTKNRGEDETRPKNAAMYYYIKIN